MEEVKHFEFDPELSEYNPIIAEIKAIKEEIIAPQKSFFGLLIERLQLRFSN